MIFQVPTFESHVSGLSLECEVVQTNVASDIPSADNIIDEFLRMTVHHDGSNPFCDIEECTWGMLFLMSTSDCIHDVMADEDDPPIQLVCLPHGVNVTHAIIDEGVYEGVSGIWVLVQTSTQTGEYEFAFNLVEYGHAG